MYIFQNHNDLYPVIQDVGCYFRSCLHIAELESHKILSPTQINRLWDKANSLGQIIDSNLKKPGPLIELGCKELGLDRTAFDVAIFKYGQIDYYGWVKSHPQYKNYKYLIQKVQTVNDHEHYRVVDVFGNVIFDPYHPSPEVSFIYSSILFYVGA